MSVIRPEIVKELGQILPPGQIMTDEPMADHCSFRTGGPADLLLRAGTAAQLTAVLTLLRGAGRGRRPGLSAGQRDQSPGG